MIENDIKELWHDLNRLRGEVSKLKSDFESKLSVDLDKWREYYSLLPTNNEKPHKCPICLGSSFCKQGMECVPCQGSGIVWG